MTAAFAAQIADRYAEQIGDSVRWLTESPDPWGKALVEVEIHQALNDGQPFTKPLPPQPRNNKMVREAKYIAQDAAVRRLWMRNRIVYDIDPDLWEELEQTATDTEIPEALLTRLPHPDPFVALPKPVVIRLDADSQMRVRGFFVVGRGMTVAEMQVSTHSPAAVGNIGLLIGGEVETLTGKPKMVKGSGMQDFVWNRVTLKRNVTTLAGHIAEIRSRFDTAPEAGGFDQTMPEAITACVSALIYICSTNAELRPLPAATVKRAAKGIKGKPPKVVEVGYISGPALRAYRQSERTEAAQPTGQTKRAHLRRAHFHTYRVGAGRAETIVKWLAPFLVGVKKSDPDKSTVVGVK